MASERSAGSLVPGAGLRIAANTSPGNPQEIVMASKRMKSLAEPIVKVSRRSFITTTTGISALALARSRRVAIVNTDVSKLPPYGNGTLPLESARDR